MSSSTDFEFFDDFGDDVERGGSEIVGDVMRAAGRLDGLGSGRDGGTAGDDDDAAATSGVRVVLGGDSFPESFADVGAASIASVAPQDAQLAVPSEAYESQRPQTMPISKSM